MLQWNLSKADTIGTNKIVHHREGVLWRGVSAKRGSTVLTRVLKLLTDFKAATFLPSDSSISSFSCSNISCVCDELIPAERLALIMHAPSSLVALNYLGLY